MVYYIRKYYNNFYKHYICSKVNDYLVQKCYFQIKKKSFDEQYRLQSQSKGIAFASLTFICLVQQVKQKLSPSYRKLPEVKIPKTGLKMLQIINYLNFRSRYNCTNVQLFGPKLGSAWIHILLFCLRALPRTDLQS